MSSSRSTPEPVHDTRSTLQPLTHLPPQGIPLNLPALSQPRLDFPQCLWGGCGQIFNNATDLAVHVNSSHLHIPSVEDPTSDARDVPAVDSPGDLACHWDNCNQYASPAQVPGSSTKIMASSVKDFLAQHVQQDHIGIRPITETVEASRSSSAVSETPHDVVGGSCMPRRPRSRSPTADTPSTQSRHVCKWKSCKHAHSPFESPADLMEHITDVHVGAGNSRYHCWWDGCTRNGDTGFTSKQKILRHVQSHTGESDQCYRPFKCGLCDQYFSETATLQQHMRRHTKEKPYVCDFPGCGKAFAITGALTIHRRVHSGSKPFKCTFCERTFAESSNLSKHIRTHTGVRPYACPYPGCGKRFARPDQVSRHKNVHAKKGLKEDEQMVE
ncbi:hypothetical protein BU17DRAFT_49371 [Hysterangium stoloniferum]|nr:hypothetical protein BU17DRAFT_49371 [Hysterangium stoloniferum]